MQAYVFILHHDTVRSLARRYIEILREIQWQGLSGAAADLPLRSFMDKGDAGGGANVHAGIALDAFVFGEYRLHIAIEAALGFLETGRQIKAQLHFLFTVGEGLLLVGLGYDVALIVYHIAVIAPFMDAHFLADKIDIRCRAVARCPSPSQTSGWR